MIKNIVHTIILGSFTITFLSAMENLEQLRQDLKRKAAIAKEVDKLLEEATKPERLRVIIKEQEKHEDTSTICHDRQLKKFGTFYGNRPPLEKERIVESLDGTKHIIKTKVLQPVACIDLNKIQPLPKKDSYLSLHDAVKSQDFNAMEKFIKDGANLDGVDENGDRPLHCAIDYGCYEAVEFLCKYGANPRLFDKSNRITPIIMAENNHDEYLMTKIINGQRENLKRRDILKEVQEQMMAQANNKRKEIQDKDGITPDLSESTRHSERLAKKQKTNFAIKK
jgi:ankyrin repeat protein